MRRYAGKQSAPLWTPSLRIGEIEIVQYFKGKTDRGEDIYINIEPLVTYP